MLGDKSASLDLLMQRLTTETDENRIWHIVVSGFHAVGIDRVSYLNVRPDSLDDRPVIKSNMPIWWREVYFSRQCILDDVLFDQQQHGRFSLYCTGKRSMSAQLCGRKLDRAQACRDMGLNAFAVVRFPCLDPQRMGGFILGGLSDVSSLELKLSETGAFTKLLGRYAHERFERQIEDMRVDADISVSSILSSREQQCLSYLANGCRTSGIAKQMNITSATVNFHFKSIRKKLGAATREEALAKSIASNLI